MSVSVLRTENQRRSQNPNGMRVSSVLASQGNKVIRGSQPTELEMRKLADSQNSIFDQLGNKQQAEARTDTRLSNNYAMKKMLHIVPSVQQAQQEIETQEAQGPK